MDKKEFALKQHEEWQGKLEIACRAKVKLPRIWLLPILRALQNPA